VVGCNSPAARKKYSKKVLDFLYAIWLNNTISLGAERKLSRQKLYMFVFFGGFCLFSSQFLQANPGRR